MKSLSLHLWIDMFRLFVGVGRWNMLQSISEKIHDTRGNYTRREDHERAKNDRSMMSDFG